MNTPSAVCHTELRWFKTNEATPPDGVSVLGAFIMGSDSVVSVLLTQYNQNSSYPFWCTVDGHGGCEPQTTELVPIAWSLITTPNIPKDS